MLYIFTNDFGGLDRVAEQLAAWTAIGSVSSLAGSVYPRLLIVTSVPNAEFHSKVLQF